MSKATMKKEMSELLVMFYFAKYISKNSNSQLDLPDPYTYLKKNSWSAIARFSYGISVATYLSNMFHSSQFCDWVKGWNADPENTSKKQYFADEWRTLVSRWVE